VKLSRPVVLAALAGAVVGSAATWFLTNTPYTYSTCVLRYVRAGMDTAAVYRVTQACELKFGAPPRK